MRNATSDDLDDIMSEIPDILLDFHAPWCGPCKAMEPHLAAVDGNPFPIVKIDVDAQPDLAARFGVRGVPTLIVVRNGRAVEARVGGQGPAALRDWLSTHST